jgi:NAD(P)H-dependent FMN reductase
LILNTQRHEYRQSPSQQERGWGEVISLIYKMLQNYIRMIHIAIISSSVRIDRKSHRVALYFQKYLIQNKIASVEILDLMEYDFPIFNEKLSLQKNPTKSVLDFADKINTADGIIIVTPEYNGGYPASLKNAIDLLYNEWHHKPIAISTVSSGDFGGSQAIMLLQFSLWKIKAFTVPALFPVPNIEKKFDEKGNSLHQEITDKLADIFINELMWFISIMQKTADENLIALAPIL